MPNELTRRYLDALDAAQATLRDIARATGRGYRTLQSYKYDERDVTVEAVQELLAYLREREKEFQRAADDLEEALSAS